MEIPLQITGRDFKITDAVRSDIQQKAEKLDKHYDRIMRCRVIVETPHLHQREGKLYNVEILINVPGAELIIKREPDADL